MELSPELGAAIISLIVAATGWIKNHSEVVSINQDRETVKANRDADSQSMHDELIRMKCTQQTQAENIKVLFEKSVDNSKQINELTSQLREVIVQMKLILDTLKEIKDK